jgi:hypothetical protein
MHLDLSPDLFLLDKREKKIEKVVLGPGADNSHARATQTFDCGGKTARDYRPPLSTDRDSVLPNTPCGDFQDMAGLEQITTRIYHERQEPGSALCAQHALNSLLRVS